MKICIAQSICLQCDFRQANLLIGTVQIVVKNVLGAQDLVTAIVQTMRRVLQSIRIVPASPAIHIAHVRTKAGLVFNGDVLGVWMKRDLTIV